MDAKTSVDELRVVVIAMTGMGSDIIQMFALVGSLGEPVVVLVGEPVERDGKEVADLNQTHFHTYADAAKPS